MSLILLMETDEGLLLAGDSRLTRENDTNWHRDDCYKVFECNDRIGIAFHGTADIKGVPIEQIINGFVTNGNVHDTVQDVALNLKNYISQQQLIPKTIFYVMGYDVNRQIYKIDFINDNFEDLSDCVHGSGGEDDVAWEMIKGNHEEHTTNTKAIKFIDVIYNETVKYVTSVGGPIDILMITRNGTKWIRKKQNCSC